jgi:hypothetical protein
MSITTITAKAAGVVLAAAAVCGLGAGAALAATPGHAAAGAAGHGKRAAGSTSAGSRVGAPMVSRGFHIYNLTSSPMTLRSISGDQNFEGAPPVGSVVQPGQYADFEVQYKVLSDQNDDVVYSNAVGSFRAHLEVDGYNFGAPSSTCTVTSGPDSCSDPDDQVTGGNGTTISFLEPAGSTITYDGSQAQQQADVLNQLCNTPGADATCRFDAQGPETKVLGDAHQVGDSFNNPTSLKVDYLLERDDSVSISDTLGVTVTAGTQLFDTIDTSVALNYQHQVTATKDDKESITVHVDPEYKVWLENSPAMIRDTGNFTITLGNTTYHLNGVHFDSPDPSGNGEWTLCAQSLSGGAVERTPLT